MKTLKEFNEWKNERGYTLREISDYDHLQYLMDQHKKFYKGTYKGMVFKFTGEIYEVYDLMCDQHVGYATVYKTSSGRKLFEYHRE
jgi:hypothetical protein